MNLAVAALDLAVAADTSELRVTYTITGAQTVPPFQIAYGLKRDAADPRPIDRPFGYARVSGADCVPGTHTLSLGDVRAVLDSLGIRNGDRVIVQLNSGDEVVESDKNDNIGAVTLAVDLVLNSVLLELHTGVSDARVVYSVKSPARVPDFVIRLGFDTNGDGAIDDPLPDVNVRGADAAPGPHVATVELPAAQLAGNTRAGASARVVAILDATGQVVESDESSNNRFVATEPGYVALAVALESQPDHGVAGDELEWIWRLRNDGLAAATGVVLSATIPDGAEFVSPARSEVLSTASAGAGNAGVRVPLGAEMRGNAVLINVGKVDAGGVADIVVVLRPRTAQTLSLQAEVTAAGGYRAQSDATQIEIAEPSTPPADMLVEETTTTVLFPGLCGVFGPFTLSACLASLLGVRARTRAALRRTIR